MDPFSLLAVAAIAATALGLYFALNERAPPAGHAMLVHRRDRTDVVLGATRLRPGRAVELIDISAKVVRVDRRRRAALACADGVRADVTVTFTVQPDPSREGVLHLARTLGARRSAQVTAVAELLEDRLAEAVAIACAERPFAALAADRAGLSARIAERVGPQLDAWRIRGVAVGHFEQAPLEAHDPEDLRDAEGLKALTEALEGARTATEAIEHQEALARARQALAARREMAEIEEALSALGGAPAEGALERLRARREEAASPELTEVESAG